MVVHCLVNVIEMV